MSASFTTKKRSLSGHLPVPQDSKVKVTLTSDKYSNKILVGLSFLRQQDLLCDYTLIAEDVHMKVHRCVMVACSDYFRAMLTGEMRESKEEKVNLHGVSSIGLNSMITFAYTGDLSLSLDNLEEILAAATYLQIGEAVDLCCTFMTMAIDVENCVDILNLTELYSLVTSRTKARKFILENFEAFSDSDQYKKLSHTQLASMLEENCLKVMSEYRLFELVLRWIYQDRSQREKHTAMLMRNVRLPLLSGEELVDKVSRIDIMKQNKDCNELLTAAKDYHIVVSKQPLLQSPRTQVRSNKKRLVMCHAENLESYNLLENRHTFLKDAPVPLYNPCVCVVDNFMYACGGKYDSNENNEIATARCFRYDARFDSWFEQTSMNEARKDFSMIGFRNCLYAIAGQDENMVICTVECFDISRNDWEAKTSLNHAVYGHAGTVCNESIFISGGQKFDGHCSMVVSYDPAADIWKDEPPLLQARSNHVMQEISGILYVLGGNVEDSYGFPVPTSTIEMFNPVDCLWTHLEAVCNIREAGSCVLNTKIYIVGGINGQHYYSDLIQSYDPENDKLEVVDKFPTRIYGKACCILTLPQYT